MGRSVCGIAVYDLDRFIRSGTGMTYNYAMLKKKIPVSIICPDTANFPPRTRNAIDNFEARSKTVVLFVVDQGQTN